MEGAGDVGVELAEQFAADRHRLLVARERLVVLALRGQNPAEIVKGGGDGGVISPGELATDGQYLPVVFQAAVVLAKATVRSADGTEGVGHLPMSFAVKFAAHVSAFSYAGSACAHWPSLSWARPTL